MLYGRDRKDKHNESCGSIPEAIAKDQLPVGGRRLAPTRLDAWQAQLRTDGEEETVVVILVLVEERKVGVGGWWCRDCGGDAPGETELGAIFVAQAPMAARLPEVAGWQFLEK